MGNDTTRLGNNLVEQLDTDKLLNGELKNNQSSDLSDILNRNSQLNQSFGWIGTSPEEVNTSLNAPRCDCLYCCGISSSDFVATNNISNLNANAEPVAATGSGSVNVPDTGNDRIDALLAGSKWTGKTITYSFFDGGSYYSNERNVRPITETMQNYLRDILENKLEKIIDVDFVEVSDVGNNYGQLRYMFSDNPISAYGYYPSNTGTGGDVHFSPNLVRDFEAGPGSFRYATMIHETLHAIGLKHPGNYDSGGNNPDPPFLAPNEDNGSNTIMSYDRFQGTSNFTGAVTPMAYDIRAIQHLYGAANNNGGNTTYKFSSISGYTVGGEFFGKRNGGVRQTIWDSSGNDTLDFSQMAFSNSGYRFDLREGGVITSQSAYNATSYRSSQNSRTYSATGTGTFLAYDMTVENVINSSSDDYIVANEGANTFSGYSLGKSTGNDVIVGSNSKDTLDLSAYKVSDFTTRSSGNDLIVDLKGNGSITVDDYYNAAERDRLTIKTAGGDPTPPDPNPSNQSLVWEEQNLRDESAVATGTKFNLGNGLTATVNWQVLTDGGDFVAYGGEDFVSYDSDKTGNHSGYLSLGFNNSNDDPDDLIKLDLNFNQAVTGLSFKLLDVDQYDEKAFDDGVEIYADGVNIKSLSGVEIVTGSNVMADNERYMKGFEGRGSTGVDNNSEEGNIEISFGSTEVSSLEIRYFSTDDAISNPDSQKIGISDLDFQVKSA